MKDKPKSETMARITPDGYVELIDDQSKIIRSIDPMTPDDAAYLARGILACAIVLSGPNPPNVATIIGDAHMPVLKWAVGSSNITGEPVLILTTPSGVELTFVMPLEGAKVIGEALLSRSQGSSPLGGHHGTVH